jgi:hypothetical protein
MVALITGFCLTFSSGGKQFIMTVVDSATR